MDYKKIYEQLIVSRKSLNRVKNNDGMLESHHIIPKCLGGSNNKENLVLLTPKEHYIAHLLLTKMYKGKDKAKMCYALLMMCNNNPNQKRSFSSRKYERVKLLISENCSGENHPNYGKKMWSDSEKKTISKRMKGENNPMFNKKPWNKGLTLKPHSKKTKEKMSQSHKGKIKTKEHRKSLSKALKGKVKSLEHKRKLSEANKGKKMSKETKEKLSKKLKGKKQKIIQCPYCNKEGGTAMYRWHFDNCKFKT